MIVIRKPHVLSISESVGPLYTYHLSRGLTLNFVGLTGTLSGGGNLSVKYCVNPDGSTDGIGTQSAYRTVLGEIQNSTTCRVLASGKWAIEAGSEDVVPPDRVPFGVGDQLASDTSLGEMLLRELNQIESRLRLLLTGGSSREQAFWSAYEQVLYWQDDLNRAGKLTPVLLDQLIASGLPMTREAFFFLNAIEIGEDMRSAILRANYHFMRMTETVWRANVGRTNAFAGPDARTAEMLAMGPDIDRISDEYMSSVVSAYSTLDILFKYFIFLTKLPFGVPDFPQDCYFPDTSPASVFREGGSKRPDDVGASTLPFAIPNLVERTFTDLRVLRNDLVHRMAPDGHRPWAYVGRQLPPVGGQPLQYTQYLCRDIQTDGNPIVHRWRRRFYSQGRDAQLTLYETIERVWQCCLDTTVWLQNRLTSMASGPTT